ncbi:energy-coupling factor transporter transmembrane component T [Bacillaceae bacterium S4-13-58]
MSLNDINPTIKAFSVVLSVLLLSIFFDPVTPSMSIALIVTITFLFGNVSFKRWILLFSPFLFIALIYVWSSMWFPEIKPSDHILWQWKFLGLTEEGLKRSISLALRVLSFASLSLLFVLTTKPIDFILSLMQQCKLSPKLAYGIMAGYRFLPTIKEELNTVRDAHRIRGIASERTWKGKLYAIKRYVIPLLASAVRKAERTALAMESKGFTGNRNRTYYRKMTVKSKDWLFLALIISIILFSILTSWYSGYLQLYKHEM